MPPDGFAAKKKIFPYNQVKLSSLGFFIIHLSMSGMNDLFLKRVLFECVRDRWKEQTNAPKFSLKEIILSENQPIFLLY